MTYKKVQSLMWAFGRPTLNEDAKRFAGVYRAGLKAGLTDGQAWALVSLAFDAASGYTWQIEQGGKALEHHVRLENARKFPNGKDAAELAGKPWPGLEMVSAR